MPAQSPVLSPTEDKFPVSVPAPAVPSQNLAPASAETQDKPRRSGWSRSSPDRLIVTGKGKSYASVVRQMPVKAMKATKAKEGCVRIIYA